MKELPVKYVPGHEVTHPPGEAARAVDQDQSGEAADQEGAKLHGSGVDVVKLWVTDREWKESCTWGSRHSVPQHCLAANRCCAHQPPREPR